MGEPDLIIVINGLAFLVKEELYVDRADAIKIGMGRFKRRWERIKEESEYPDELIGEDEIKEIRVYGLIE